MTIRRAHVWASGRVQGVSYREAARREAERCGVLGWVKNLPDGRVEAVLEGSADAVEELIRFLRRGPEFAHVSSIEIVDEPPEEGFSRFEIARAK